MDGQPRSLPTVAHQSAYRHLIEGEFPQFSDSASTNRVVISKAIADKLKLKLGDKIDTYYIQDDVRARRLTIVGIYQTNFSEYDNLFLLTDLCLVNRLNKWHPDQVSGVELELYDYLSKGICSQKSRSTVSSESRHELIAIDTKRKLAMLTRPRCLC